MTLINQTKHISAERDEKVIIDAQLNSSTGILTFKRKDYYNNKDSDPINTNNSNFKDIQLDLSKIKLRIIVLEDEEELGRLANSSNQEDITTRETNIFLIPFDDNGVEEGVYREYIWSDEKNDFEVIGSTKVDLEPLLKKEKVLNNYNDVPNSFDSDNPTVLSSNLVKTLKNDFDTHVHGNLSNDGKIGTTANKPIITTTQGALTTGSFESTATNIKKNGTQSVGSRNTFARGDHVHPTDDTRAPVQHDSVDTTYGAASTDKYGHTKLSTAINSTSTSLAATPKAVKDAYDLANSKSHVEINQIKNNGINIATITIDDTPTEIYQQDTTYSAENGITLSNDNKFGHSNSAIIAVTTAALRKITYDQYGHITAGPAVRVDSTPTDNPNNLVSSQGVYSILLEILDELKFDEE